MSEKSGVGIVLAMLLNGDVASAKTFAGAVGKTIATIMLDADWRSSNALVFTFTDGTGIRLRDDGQNCCERRYMHTDDALDGFVGAELWEAEIRNAPNIPDEYGAHEVQFLIVKTSLGEFTVETHNEHNGYYGGFRIVVEPETKEE